MESTQNRLENPADQKVLERIDFHGWAAVEFLKKEDQQLLDGINVGHCVIRLYAQDLIAPLNKTSSHYQVTVKGKTYLPQ